MRDTPDPPIVPPLPEGVPEPPPPRPDLDLITYIERGPGKPPEPRHSRA
jgi:hypothetical protein